MKDLVLVFGPLAAGVALMVISLAGAFILPGLQPTTILVAILFFAGGFAFGSSSRYKATGLLAFICGPFVLLALPIALGNSVVVLLPIVAIISTATGLYLRSRLQTRGVPRLIVTVLAWGALMGVTAYILVPRAIDAQLTSRPMTPLPPLTLFAQDSVAVAIVPAGGTILVMNFWATWCGPCIREFPELERVYIRFRDNPRVQVYIVNSGWQGDTPEKVAAFLKDRRLPFRSLLDREGTVAKTLEISSIPVTLVVDGHGIVRLRRSGFSAEGRSYADILCDEIDALLQEQ